MESKILAGLSFDPGILIIGMFILMLLMLIYIYTLHRKQNQLDKKYRAFMRGGRGAKSLDEALQNKMQSLNKITDVNDGFIINSIHSKDGCYNYIKEIIKGESYIPLGDEEAEALEQAKQYGMGNE